MSGEVEAVLVLQVVFAFLDMIVMRPNRFRRGPSRAKPPSLNAIYISLWAFIDAWSPPQAPKKGSSRVTGKGGFDLEEEVVAVPVVIGHALDDLDTVVHAFQHAGVEPIDGAGDDALGVGLQARGEADQRREAACLSHVEPSCPTPPGGPLGAGVPELLELTLHQIHHHQGLIQIQ